MQKVKIIYELAEIRIILLDDNEIICTSNMFGGGENEDTDGWT